MKTKWGTCSQKSRRIWINLELAKKPFQCLDYIVLHEMTHLIEKNHTAKFKSLMNSAMPQWLQYKEELNARVPKCEGFEELSRKVFFLPPKEKNLSYL